MLGEGRRRATRARRRKRAAARGRRARPRHLRHARPSSRRWGSSMSEGVAPACGCAAAPRRAAISSPTTCRRTPPRATPSCSRSWARPTPRQIDGMGGADPLTSKVAVVRQVRARRASTSTICSCRSSSTRPIVTDAQNCGNILAGVGPFAIERGLVGGAGRRDRGARSSWRTPARSRDRDRRRRRAAGSTYAGDARIDGVPGTARAGADRLPRHRRLDLRRAAADRQRGRRDRGRALHADRQRHALRRDARRRCRRRPATRRRDALEADARPAGADRGDPARGRAADEPRRRHGQVGAEDDAGRARRGTAARSPPAASSRTAATPRSACSARSASRPPACCRPAGGGGRGGAGGRGKAARRSSTRPAR